MEPARILLSRQNNSVGLAGGLACVLIITLGVNILNARFIINKVISLSVLKNIAPKRITGEKTVKFKLAPCSVYRTTPWCIKHH